MIALQPIGGYLPDPSLPERGGAYDGLRATHAHSDGVATDRVYLEHSEKVKPPVP